MVDVARHRDTKALRSPGRVNRRSDIHIVYVHELRPGKDVRRQFVRAQRQTWVAVRQDDPGSSFWMDENRRRLRRRLVLDEVRHVDTAASERVANATSILVAAYDADVFAAQPECAACPDRGCRLAAAAQGLSAKRDLSGGQKGGRPVGKHEHVVNRVGTDANDVERRAAHGLSIRLEPRATSSRDADHRGFKQIFRRPVSDRPRRRRAWKGAGLKNESVDCFGRTLSFFNPAPFHEPGSARLPVAIGERQSIRYSQVVRSREMTDS